jgi:hypothetical protein
VGISVFYHCCIYKKPTLEDESDHTSYDQKHAAEDFYKENHNLKPTPRDGKHNPPAKKKENSDIDDGAKEAMKPMENVKESSLIKEDEEAIPIKQFRTENKSSRYIKETTDKDRYR